MTAHAGRGAAGGPDTGPVLDLDLSSLNDLLHVAGEVDVGSVTLRRGAVIARWRFAGRPYRLLLEPGTAAVHARAARERLLSTVGDPALAAALAGPPLRPDAAETRPRATIAPHPGRAPARRPGADPAIGTGPAPGVDPAPAADPAPDPAPAPGHLESRSDGGWRPHRLLPAPTLDPITGLLHRVSRRPGGPALPPGFVHLHAELPALASVDPRYQPDALAPAAAWAGTGEPPERAAIRSGIAHLCGAYLGQGTLRHASERALRYRGDRRLTVARWWPHDPALHGSAGFPFAEESPAAPSWWLLGVERGGPCWVPLSLVHAGYPASALPGLAVTNGHNLVGLAAGTSRTEALDRAAAHVIAHDAVARWWHRDGGSLDPAALPGAAVSGWGASPLRPRVLRVPSPYGIPVRLAVVEDPERGIVSLGFGCAASAESAALEALGEALIQYVSAADLDTAEGLIRRAQQLGNGGVAGLAPHDPRRRYAREAFADRRALVDPMCHVQYGLDPAVVEDTLRRTRPRPERGARLPHGDAVRRASPAARSSPFAALAASGTRVISVDVATEGVRAAGLHAQRVLAPDLDRLAVGAFPRAIADAAAPYPGW